MRITGQPPLPIFPSPRFAAVDFREAPSNAEACTWLRLTSNWPDHRLALWGGSGRGKTHLLRIWAAATGAVHWSGAALRGLPEGLPEVGIALDDADRVADETDLLHLLNAAAEAALPVLLVASSPPSRWPVRLPDLASRLRAIVSVEIGPPEDALLCALIARLFAARQLRNLEPVQQWLLQRLPRNAAVIGAAVHRLDTASLAQQRKITVSFAAEVLADLLTADECSESDSIIAKD
jgi:chromosomal replication initiation ATPase DnaA